MYIIKNALKCIGRSKGRNILIGVIVLVIAVSACIGLSIRQAAESARSESLSTMNVTASISFDRQSLMSGMIGSGGFDRSQFSQLMGGFSSLSLEEYQKYAVAESVQDFYYSMTVSVNGTEGFEPVSAEAENDPSDDAEAEDDPSDDSQEQSGFGGARGGGMSGRFGTSGDFTVVGCSSDAAMTSFINGTASITQGAVFEEGTSDHDCIISEELAAFNNLSVGDTIEVSNPNSETEIYQLTIVGLFIDSSANESSFPMIRMIANDPANKIYMSYAALQSIVDASEAVSVTEINENTGVEYETALTGALSGTYVFADTDAYHRFEEEVRALGLDNSYTVSSTDLAAYENRLTPLNTLSTMAGWFLLVILLIGAVILVVLNIFNIRERKYEIGVLTAMGMKKGKVAMQFLAEAFVVTLAAVMIGIGIGAVASVPVTNALLENQVAAQQEQAANISDNFGRGTSGMFAGMMGGGSFSGSGNPFANLFGGTPETNYVTEISSAMNFAVVLQMLGIAVLLTLVSGMVSMLFIMRYEPLKILANRD